jgi:hypothetical protein
MKTAMQELIDDLKELKKDSKERNQDSSFDIGMTFAIARAELRLEKEKEQIMDAYCDGAKGGANGTKGQHEFGWVSRHTRKKYYNQTYNQNK